MVLAQLHRFCVIRVGNRVQVHQSGQEPDASGFCSVAENSLIPRIPCQLFCYGHAYMGRNLCLLVTTQSLEEKLQQIASHGVKMTGSTAVLSNRRKKLKQRSQCILIIHSHLIRYIHMQVLSQTVEYNCTIGRWKRQLNIHMVFKLVSMCHLCP